MVSIRKASKKVSKTADKKPRDYELVLVVSPDVMDEVFEAAIDKISKFITERGGAISSVDQWGEKKLAYPIRHFVKGKYVLIQFKSGPALGRELEASLQISEEVLRHLLVKVGS